LSVALDKADIPFSPIYDYPGLFNDPQVVERKMAVEITHPLSGKMRMVANPIKFSATPIEEYSAPPLLGEHQEEILSGLLGMNAEEIAALREQGAI